MSCSIPMVDQLIVSPTANPGQYSDQHDEPVRGP
jgi:hypothetical protein